MSKKPNLNTVTVTAVFLLGMVSVAAGGIIYVDTDAPGPIHDGSSWANAYIYLQDALSTSSSGDEIRIAQGIYKPDSGGGNTPGNRQATFQLINGVALYGGFLSGGMWNDRDSDTYETILSGNIGIPGDNSDNSYHVVTGSGTDATAILDGFTITAGNAESPPDHTGAGMFNDSGSPTVLKCTFSGNISWGDGAGLSNYENSSPTVSNCVFIDNVASMGGPYSGGGGGLANVSSNPTIVNCTFRDNSAYYGGGMHSSRTSTPTLINCVFIANSADLDAGAMNNNQSDATVINCTFYGNSSDWRVGGMLNITCSPTVTNCILWGNTDVKHSSGEASQISGGLGKMEINHCCIQHLYRERVGSGIVCHWRHELPQKTHNTLACSEL